LRPLRLIRVASLYRATVASGLGLALLAAVGGCDTRGFYDPTEMGRYGTQPLAIPILHAVDPAVEDGTDDFASATDPTPEDQRPTKGDYTVSRNDLLQITISDLQPGAGETQKVTRVSDSGNISLPYINSLHAAGMTEIELEQAIVEAYRNANLIQNAQVSVSDVEPRGRTFSIMGAVGAPGEYQIIDSEFRVLNALVMAHDTQTTGIDYLYIVRQNQPATDHGAGAAPGATPPPATGPAAPDELAPKTEAPHVSGAAVADSSSSQHVLSLLADAATTEPATPAAPAASEPSLVPPPPAADATAPAKGFEFEEPGSEDLNRIIRIPLDALRKGDLRYNIPLRARDLIIVPVPEAGEFYMGGHVQRPGAFTLTGRKITLKEAVVSAGMLDQVAIPQRTDIIRRIKPDHEIFVRVDLSQIFAGNQPDVYLKPYDQVMVGTNALASFIAAARGAFRITYGFGFLYDRNFSSGNQGL
jgi:polysaccharide export outer membrane protein